MATGAKAEGTEATRRPSGSASAARLRPGSPFGRQKAVNGTEGQVNKRQATQTGAPADSSQKDSHPRKRSKLETLAELEANG